MSGGLGIRPWMQEPEYCDGFRGDNRFLGHVNLDPTVREVFPELVEEVGLWVQSSRHGKFFDNGVGMPYRHPSFRCPCFI
jgi:hypothetical protein